MDVARERRILDLLEKALKLTLEKQKILLDELEGGDNSLWGEMKELLDIKTDKMKVLNKPLYKPDLFGAGVESRAPPPEILKDCHIMAEIGRGGMGIVYLARGTQGKVAVKILKRGLDTEDFLRRFHNERHILGQLKHPNIAGLYDYGMTECGRPYFVMEYVDGAPVHTWCNVRHRNLRERLLLFLKICESVHFAHKQGVIHRDLKPGNIMITAEGQPKLLDFGIAKMFHDNETQGPTVTVTARRVLTPRYASPEHISGRTVTPAADVWSLGILLFELLSGNHPFGGKSSTLDETIRRIREEKPLKVSQALKQNPTALTRPDCRPRDLVGEIDDIIMKALTRDPSKRYQSVSQLANDITRHLEGKPVLASRHSIRNQMKMGRARLRQTILSALLWTAMISARISL